MATRRKKPSKTSAKDLLQKLEKSRTATKRKTSSVLKRAKIRSRRARRRA